MGSTRADLDRLDDALDLTGAARLVILGDLLHHKRGLDEPTVATVARWRAARPDLRVTLIRGNHDRAAGDPPRAWDIECLSGPVALGPFRLVHEPDDPDSTDDALDGFGGFTLAGHIHPCVRLYGAGRQSMRACCFHFSKRLALLPAFGSFTGGYTIRPRVGDQVFAVGDDRVLPLTASR